MRNASKKAPAHEGRRLARLANTDFDSDRTIITLQYRLAETPCEEAEAICYRFKEKANEQ